MRLDRSRSLCLSLLLIELQEHTLAAVLVVGLLSLVALVYLLTNFPMLVAAAMGLIAFVAAVIFSRRIREQQEQRDWTDSVPAEGNVSFTDTGALQPIGQPTGLSAEAQAARQPALVPAHELPREPAPQSVPQAEWTTECDTAVAALVCLRIPKCESIALVRQSAGTTADEKRYCGADLLTTI